jgi:hypothetical protein
MRVLGFVIMRTSTYRRHIDDALEAAQLISRVEGPGNTATARAPIRPGPGEADRPDRVRLRVVPGDASDWI